MLGQNEARISAIFSARYASDNKKHPYDLDYYRLESLELSDQQVIIKLEIWRDKDNTYQLFNQSEEKASDMLLKTNAILIIIDVTVYTSFNHPTQLKKIVAQRCQESSKVFLIADCSNVSDSHPRIISNADAKRYAEQQLKATAYYEISGISDEKLTKEMNDIFARVTEILYEKKHVPEIGSGYNYSR